MPAVPVPSRVAMHLLKNLGLLCLCCFGGTPVDDELRPTIDALWSLDESVRLRAVHELSDLGPRAAEAVPDLVQKLEDENEEIALGAYSAVRKIGMAGVPYLLRFMRDTQEKEKFRWYAAEALADLGPAALPHLLKAMDDEDLAVRMMAVDSLPRVGIVAEQAIPKLKGYLREDSNLSHSAVVSLAQIAALQAKAGSESPSALGVLLEALKTGPPLLRGRVVEAFEFMGDKIALAVPALKEATRDQDEEVRGNAVWLLNKLKIKH